MASCFRPRRCARRDLGVGTLDPRAASPSVFPGTPKGLAFSPCLHRGLILHSPAKRTRDTLSGCPLSFWCARRDLNPYVIQHTPLKRACLPIPALALSDKWYYSIFAARLSTRIRLFFKARPQCARIRRSSGIRSAPPAANWRKDAPEGTGAAGERRAFSRCPGRRKGRRNTGPPS